MVLRADINAARMLGSMPLQTSGLTKRAPVGVVMICELGIVLASSG